MADRHEQVKAIIDAALRRTDLTPDEILKLTIASRLNLCSSNDFTQIMSGAPVPGRPQTFWDKLGI